MPQPVPDAFSPLPPSPPGADLLEIVERHRTQASSDLFVDRPEVVPERLRGVQIEAVIAEVARADGAYEYSLLAARVPSSLNRYPGAAGSVGAEWVRVGVRIGVRKRGRRTWLALEPRVHASSLLALEALAADFDLPDAALINPLLIELRKSHRAALAEASDASVTLASPAASLEEPSSPEEPPSMEE